MTLVAEVDLIGLGDGLGVLRQPTTPGRQDQAAAGAVAFSCHFFCSVQILRCRGRVKLLVTYPASSVHWQVHPPSTSGTFGPARLQTRE